MFVLPSSSKKLGFLLALLLAGFAGHRSVDSPPYSPDEALELFEIEDGFRIELFASEPLIIVGGIDRIVARSELASIQSTNISLMPEGLYQAVSVAEMADLIAYLRFR